MSINLVKKNSTDESIYQLLEQNEDIQEQLQFWQPIFTINNALWDYVKSINYYDYYLRYELQKDLGINKFFDFVICSYTKSQYFKLSSHTEKKLLQTIIKGRLQ